MGFFNGTTTETVSSVVYNLAGDGTPVSYIKSVVAGHIVMGSKNTIGESIVSGLRNGPGLRVKQFARWAAASGYAALVGSLTGSSGGGDSIDQDALRNSIPHGATETVVLDHTSIGSADISFWADAYMADNHPSEVSGGYTVDMDASGTGITITLPGGTAYTTPLTNFDSTALYLYVAYHINPLIGSSGPVKTIIYKRYSGNSLYDSFFTNYSPIGGFLPHIPVRVSNAMISDHHYAALYPWVKKAVKKALPNGNFDQLTASLEDNNPSIGDIDHATIMFGVPMTTISRDGRQYLYSFFETMLAAGNSGVTQIQVASQAAALPFSIRITWESLSLSVLPGQFTSGAKPGDGQITGSGLTTYVTVQRTTNSYGVFAIYALAYVNHVYNGQSVIVMPGTAGYTPDQLEQLVIPLNIGILNQLSLVDANQLANYTGHIIFNCYEKVKSRWYESGVLNLALMVVTVAVSISTAGVGGASVGVLGSTASIGAALGFSGVLATLIGTIANSVAAMLVMKVLQQGAVMVFGEQLGMIIGTIAGMVAMSYGTAYMNNQPMSGVMTDMLKPDSLMRLSSSVGKGYSEYLSTNIQGIMDASTALQAESDRLYAQMDEMYASLRGNSLNVVNPLNFTDVLAEAGETRDSFLTRTLMTGPEIAQMSIDMLNQYAELSLSTDLP